MSTIPAYNVAENYNHHPHVVILGAGASLAAFPDGDKNGKKLPLMNNIVRTINIGNDLQQLGIKGEIKDFEATFDDLSNKFRGNIHFENIKTKIYQYFSEFEIPDRLTLYDKLILSLRENDLIATFNWDPLLNLAIQRNRHIKRLPQVAFLHGNVFVGICKEHKTVGFINCACSKCGRRFEKVDLLYPVKNKDYTKNEFIRGEWDLLKGYLEIAYLITIFGYSAPKTDVAARELMLNVWKENKIRDFGEIEIIDIAQKETVEENWSDFFIKQHYWITDSFENSYLNYYPRRSCEAFASSSLYNSPWGDIDKFTGNTLTDYQTWIKKLIVSEELHELDNSKPLSKW
jgi:hypothetical protein